MRFVFTCIVLGGLWALLTEARPDSWIVGGPVVLLAAMIEMRLVPDQSWGLSAGGLVRFVIHFTKNSIMGAIDIGWRSFHPGLPIDPMLIEYQLRLPAGAARTFFMNVVNLLPGTVSADICGDRLTVHVMDVKQPINDKLARLEHVVAMLFAMPWIEPSEAT